MEQFARHDVEVDADTITLDTLSIIPDGFRCTIPMAAQ
jgi:hypothetical protein